MLLPQQGRRAQSKRSTPTISPSLSLTVIVDALKWAPMTMGSKVTEEQTKGLQISD